MSRFTASDDEQLIELVQGHPIIWNIMEKDYKNVVKKEFIWSDIGKTMNKTGTECKARWKNMRDYFRKQKKEERNQTTGSAATKRKAGYWERLRFLDVVPEERCSLTNIESSVSEESFGDQLDYVDDLLDLTASNVQGDISECETSSNTGNRGDETKTEKPKQNKRKKVMQDSSILGILNSRQSAREEHRRKVELLLEKREEDEMDLFFKTMAATTRNFSKDLKRQAKIKVFNIITELEGLQQGGFSTFNYDSSVPSTSVGLQSNRHTYTERPLPVNDFVFDSSWLQKNN